MEQVKEKVQSGFNTMKDKFGWSNIFQSPRIKKVIISVGIGRVRKDKRKIEVIINRLEKITGQKPAYTKAKKSIASFKLRQGEKIGYMATLRGKNMYSFLDRLIHISLPRSRDFKGIKKESIDEKGNLTIGIKEHTAFPETSDEDLQDVFGFGVTIVTTAKNKEEATRFFEHIGIPFSRN